MSNRGRAQELVVMGKGTLWVDIIESALDQAERKGMERAATICLEYYRGTHASGIYHAHNCMVFINKAMTKRSKDTEDE